MFRELVRRANAAAIAGKRYAPWIEEMAERNCPRFSAAEINAAWARSMERDAIPLAKQNHHRLFPRVWQAFSGFFSKNPACGSHDSKLCSTKKEALP